MKKTLETNLHLGSVWCIECGIFSRHGMNSSVIKRRFVEYQRMVDESRMVVPDRLDRHDVILFL